MLCGLLFITFFHFFIRNYQSTNSLLAHQFSSANYSLTSLKISLTSSANTSIRQLFYFTEWIANAELEMLHWLRGTPAGLKLVAELSHFLSGLFGYYTQLSFGYYNFLESLILFSMPYVLLSVVTFGGLSLLVILLRQLFRALALHIFCIYLHCARMYRIELVVLGSLTRLLLGRKWNPLRERVDSVAPTADRRAGGFSSAQLACASLVFATALCLAPTICLYYFVFASLRVAILCIEWSLDAMARALLEPHRWVPRLWLLLQWLAFADNPRVREPFICVCEAPADESLTLQVQWKRVSLHSILSSATASSSQEATAISEHSLRSQMSRLIYGHIV